MVHLKTMVYIRACRSHSRGLCFIFHHGTWGMSLFGFPGKPCPVCLLLGGRHHARSPGLDGIAAITNLRVGEDRFNFENESLNSPVRRSILYSVNIPMIFYWKGGPHNGYINITSIRSVARLCWVLPARQVFRHNRSVHKAARHQRASP